MRFIFGGEPVLIDRYGVGVMVDRYFMPDCWEGQPLRLVLIEQERRTVAIPLQPCEVRQAPIDLVRCPWWTRLGSSWNAEVGGRKESTVPRVSVGELVKEVGMMLTDLEQEVDPSAEWFSVVKQGSMCWQSELNGSRRCEPRGASFVFENTVRRHGGGSLVDREDASCRAVKFSAANCRMGHLRNGK